MGRGCGSGRRPMSAALQLPIVWGAGNTHKAWKLDSERKTVNAASALEQKRETRPETSLAFYRKHSEKMLRRYLYASMQVGRSPSILGDPIARGWVSSRPVRTFEDAVVFVLDVESCMNRLSSLERQMLSRLVLQEYTYTEAAPMLGISVRALAYKFPQ